MSFNRLWFNNFAYIVITSCLFSNAYAYQSDKKQSKVVINAPVNTNTKVLAKKPKRVRVTVTRQENSHVEAARPSFATALGLRGQNDELSLKSSVAMVVNQDTKDVYFEKNPSVSLPIASITKLMTAT